MITSTLGATAPSPVHARAYNDDNDEQFIRDLLPYLKDPRYIRIDGRPLLIVYRPSLLPDAKHTLELWRDYCRAQGLGELFLAMVQFDVDDPTRYGFDAALEFPPHKLARGLPSINDKLEVVNPAYEGYVVEYGDVIERARHAGIPSYPLIRGVFPTWDNEARKPGRGYTFANSTPALYRGWLEEAVQYAHEHPVAGEHLVFINAWNEWAEGAYLEPDRRYGYAYLQATRDVLDASGCKPKVLVVSHDAHPHGAQYLALNLVRELQSLDVEVEVALLGGGRLQDDFRALCPVHELSGASAHAVEALAQSLRFRGFHSAFVNTAVSGRVARPLRSAGLRIVSLVHELPGVIRDYKLEQEVQALTECSDRLVVASNAVAEGLLKFVDDAALRRVLTVRPQGLFTRSRYRGMSDRTQARSVLRRKLGLPDHARIVVAVGYADERKGADLLVQVARICGQRLPDLHFVWVGHRDETLCARLDADLARNGMAERFHFCGLDFDTDDYYAGADVYALASREDPFPSVVLESLSVATPVVAFAGTGGGADLVARCGGVVVPAFDVTAYADAIERLLLDEALRGSYGRAGAEMIDAQFSFRAYAMDLMAMGGMALPRVSVIVPNYNYGHYLQERLQSIIDQQLPVYEIIVLDDGSSDDSLAVIQAMRQKMCPEPRVVINRVNSGSVFRQWLRGVELARGELVWIAEADDLAAPDFLQRVATPLAADPTVVMSYCQSEQIDQFGQTLAQDYLAYTDDLSKERWRRSYVADGQEEVVAALSIKNTVPNVSAVVFRREALLDVLRSDIEEIASYRIAGDWVAYLKLLKKGRIMFDPKSCNRHRRHTSSVTLGSAAEPHYREVLRAQRVAEELFELSAASRRMRSDYTRSLHSHFGLSDALLADG
jgi:glycosyltransferase involved in cell wall biosynthesis